MFLFFLTKHQGIKFLNGYMKPKWIAVIVDYYGNMLFLYNIENWLMKMCANAG